MTKRKKQQTKKRNNTKNNKKVKVEMAYVGLENVKEIRKQLLNSAKEVLIILKEIQVYKQKNKELIEKNSLIKENLNSLTDLTKDLINRLPKIKIDEKPKKVIKEKKIDIENKDDNIYKIEMEIRKIEEMLKEI